MPLPLVVEVDRVNYFSFLVILNDLPRGPANHVTGVDWCDGQTLSFVYKAEKHKKTAEHCA